MNSPADKAFCHNCKAHVSYHEVPLDNKKQLRITLFTLGIWAPIWLLMSFSKHHVCDLCGEPVSAE